MSILSAIKNFAYEVLGVEKTTDTASKTAPKESSRASVIECKTEAPEDRVEISNKAAVESKEAANPNALNDTVKNLRPH